VADADGSITDAAVLRGRLCELREKLIHALARSKLSLEIGQI
jgi:hypothetical protein